MMVISKVIAAGLTTAAIGLIALESWWRSAKHQRERIQRKLEQPLFIDVPRSLFLKHTRSVEVHFLKRYFSGAPAGPVFIVGPTGTGKSELMKEVMSSTKMSLYMDLHKNPVSSGEEFFFWLVDSTGYSIPRHTEIARFLLREPPRKSRITHEELEAALYAVDSVLELEKKKKWPRGVPIICIDDLYKLLMAVCGRQSTSSLANFSAIALSDPYFNKFMDWCEHLINNQLAHLVFVTSTSHLGEINALDAFKRYRSLVWINHPSPEGIRNYLKEEFTRTTEELEKQNKPILSDTQIDWIEKCIGGHVEDLDQVTIALKRGETFNTVLRRMVSESINLVETRFDFILKEASKIDDNAIILEKYLRFWRLIEVLRDYRYVNRRDIINLIFKDHIGELDEYVALDIIAYLTRGGGSRPTEPEIIEAVVDADQPEIPISVDKKKVDFNMETESYMLLTEGLGGIIVTAASARLRIAFDSLLKHPRMIKQRRRVESHLRLKSLKDERNILISNKTELNKERQIHTEELSHLITNSEKWKTELSPEAYAKRKLRVIELEGEVEVKLKTLSEEIQRLDEDIQKLLKKARRAVSPI